MVGSFFGFLSEQKAGSAILRNNNVAPMGVDQDSWHPNDHEQLFPFSGEGHFLCGFPNGHPM